MATSLLDAARFTAPGLDTEQHGLLASLDGMSDAFVAIDRDFLITHVNRAAEQLFGKPRATLVGANLLATVPEWLGGPFGLSLRASMRDNAPAAVEEYCAGYQAWFEARTFPTEKGMSIFVRDVTRARLAEQEREQLISAHERQEQALREQSEIAETLNRVGQLFARELDEKKLVQAITDAATIVTGAAFGAFMYNVTDERGERYRLYTLSGAPRELFHKFGMPRNTAVFGATFHGDGVVRVDDITKDPRYGRNAPHHGVPEGHLPVSSYLAVPVISREGSVLGGLFFGHSRPGVFTERSERLAVGLAAQAAVAMDNARLFQLSKQNEELQARRARQAALGSEVGQLIAAGGELNSILQRCAESVVRHLDAAFARIWLLDESEQLLQLRASAGLYRHLDGAHARVPVGMMKIGRIAEEGEPHLTNDVLNDPRIGDREWARREGMVAFAGYPLMIEEKAVGVLAMFAKRPLPSDTLAALASVATVLASSLQRRAELAERERLFSALNASKAELDGLVHRAEQEVVPALRALYSLLETPEPELPAAREKLRALNQLVEELLALALKTGPRR